MRIAALLNLTQIDVNGLDLRGKLGVVDIDNLELLTALDHGNVPVLEIYHTVGIFNNRTGVGTDEELIVTDTYHQRTLLSGRDDGIGITFVENGNGIGTDHLMQHQLDGCEQIEVLLHLYVFHELHQHLCIGIAPERHALLLQLPFQVGIVLNDTIMDDGQVLGLRKMRMGIHGGRFSVRCPSRMCYTDCSSIIFITTKLFEVADLSFGLIHIQGALCVDHGDSRTVVASVFQPLQSFNQNGISLTLPNVSYNSAHIVLMFVFICVCDSSVLVT